MITILKLTFANIKQKKFRTVLIILSIILSVALLYSVLSLSNSTTDIFLQKIKKEVGNAEVMIMPKENTGQSYVTQLSFDDVDGMEYHIPFLAAYGYSEINEDTVAISFTGMSEGDYKTIYGIEFIEKNSEGLSDHNVYIGNETASKYNLVLGDELKVTIAGADNLFIINGIMNDKNNSLGYNLGNLDLLISKETLNTILGSDGKESGYYVKNFSYYDKDTLITNLKKAYPVNEISDLTDLNDYKQMINMIVSSLLLMVMAVVMISAFIIYSSFKIIAIDRMPLMGTLRSVGATRKLTVKTLIYEAAFYGIMGGIFGSALGVLILSAAMKLLLDTFQIAVEKISYFNISYIIVSMLIGLGLAIGSALIPVISMSRKSIRSIIFSEIKNEKHISVYKTIIGFLLVAIAFILFYTAPLEFQMAMDLVGIIFIVVGGAFIIPIISLILTKLLSFLLKPIYKDGLGVVTANIKNDRTMMNNIMLLAMGLSVILMINNFSSTVSTAVADVYESAKTDALVSANMDQDFINQVRKVEGIEHVYTTKEVYDIEANNGAINIMFLCGMDGRGYSEYAWDEFGKYLTDDLLEQYKSKRSILISKFMARKYDLSVGDVLTLNLNDKDVDYEVLGIVPTIMNNGNVSYVYDKFLAKDAGIDNYQSMYLNMKDKADEKQVLKTIKELMPYGILPIQTLSDMRKQNFQSNNAVFFLMKAISLIAMFIGVIGILNNFTISFLSRRKLTATMRSLGLSKRKTVQNMLLEAFICGLLGTVSGLVLGTVLIKAMSFVIDAMGIPSEVMFYNFKEYVFVLASGILLSVISAIIPAVSISKDNIVSGLKYE